MFNTMELHYLFTAINRFTVSLRTRSQVSFPGVRRLLTDY